MQFLYFRFGTHRKEIIICRLCISIINIRVITFVILETCFPLSEFIIFPSPNLTFIIYKMYLPYRKEMDESVKFSQYN